MGTGSGSCQSVSHMSWPGQELKCATVKSGVPSIKVHSMYYSFCVHPITAAVCGAPILQDGGPCLSWVGGLRPVVCGDGGRTVLCSSLSSLRARAEGLTAPYTVHTQVLHMHVRTHVL
jgi:hypothetical protein